jgi:hypothetical protein
LDVVRAGQEACASADGAADYGAGERIAQQGSGCRAGAGTDQAAGRRTITRRMTAGGKAKKGHAGDERKSSFHDLSPVYSPREGRALI